MHWPSFTVALGYLCTWRSSKIPPGSDRISPDEDALGGQWWATHYDAEEDEPGAPQPGLGGRARPEAAETHHLGCEQDHLPRSELTFLPFSADLQV